MTEILDLSNINGSVCIYFSNLMKIFLRIALSTLTKVYSSHNFITISCSIAMNSKQLLIYIMMTNLMLLTNVQLVFSISWFSCFNRLTCVEVSGCCWVFWGLLFTV